MSRRCRADAPSERSPDRPSDRPTRKGAIDLPPAPDAAAVDKLSPRQLEIMDRAVELLREQGLPGLTVRRLAERMGFSEAALYRHFASKEELLVLLVGRMAEGRLLGPIRAIATDAERPPRERLEAVLAHQLSMLAELEGVPLLFLAEALASEDDRLLARARWVTGSMVAVLASLIAEALETEALEAEETDRSGEPGPGPTPRDLAFTLFGLAVGSALRFRLASDPREHPEGERLVRLARFVVRRLLGEGETSSPVLDERSRGREEETEQDTDESEETP